MMFLNYDSAAHTPNCKLARSYH